jgi:hypothetical protein
MLKVLVVLAVLGFVLISAATAILAWLNWSSRLYTPVITALLIGVLTGFVSIASTLKASRISKAFATAAVVYRDQPMAPVVLPRTVRAAQRFDFAGLLSQVPHSNPNRASVDDVINVGVEAAQYSVFKLIREIDAGGWASANIGGVTTPIVRTSSPTRLVAIDARALQSALAATRFADIPTEKFYWQTLTFTAPPGTKVEMYHVPSSPSTGVERRGIRLSKSLFFNIDVTIEPLGLDSGLLSDVDVSPADQSRAGTLLFRISGVADFDRLTAGNQRTDDYKRWVEWLLGELSARLSVGG